MPGWLCPLMGRGTVFGPPTTLHSHREASGPAQDGGNPPVPPVGLFGQKSDGVPFKAWQ